MGCLIRTATCNPSDLMGDAGQKSLDSRPHKIHTQINLIYDANLQPLICRAPHIHDTVMVSSKQMTVFMLFDIISKVKY